jgi:hypothetical protein
MQASALVRSCTFNSNGIYDDSVDFFKDNDSTVHIFLEDGHDISKIYEDIAKNTVINKCI